MVQSHQASGNVGNVGGGGGSGQHHQFNITDLNFLSGVGGSAGTNNQVISLADQEDEEMRRVLEASKRDIEMKDGDSAVSTSTSSTTTMGLSQQELEEARIIEQSFQNTKGDIGLAFSADNPTYRKREEGIPVGLKNIGNTCYFNSLLQTYFTIPQFRNNVFKYPLDSINSTKENTTTLDFIKELQLLFANLSNSSQKYVDPSNLLNKLVDKDGKKIVIGDQQDVGDYSDLFLGLYSKALELIPEDKKDKDFNNNLVKELFFGQGEEILKNQEEDNKTKETSKNIEFSSIILPSEEETNIHDAIDKFIVNDVEFTTEQGFKTKGQGVLWLKKLPKILLLQESRVHYDIEKKSYIKSNHPLYFDKEIYMDRYLFDNKEESSKIRTIVNSWKNDLKLLQSQLKSHEQYNGKSHSLLDALESVNNFYKESLASSSTSTVYSTIIDQISKDIDIESKIVIDLKTKIAELETKIKSAYEIDTLKKESYVFIGSWCHQGSSPTSGHYWSYLLDPKLNKYIKYDDMRVSIVEEDIVLKDTTGQNNTSASFLIYIQKEYLSQVENQVSQVELPSQLEKQVSDNNAKFLKELEEFEKKSSGDKFQQFVSKYREKLNEIEKLTKEYLPNTNKDTRTENYYVFLESLGQQTLIIPIVFLDIYQQIFNRPFSQDIGTSIHNKLESSLGKEVLTMVLESSLSNDSQLQLLKSQHESFQEVSQFITTGISYLLEKKYKEALQNLYSGLEHDKKLKFETSRRGDIICKYLAVALLCQFDHASNLTSSGLVANGISEFTSIVNVAKLSFNLNHPFIIRLKAKLLDFIDKNPGVCKYYGK